MEVLLAQPRGFCAGVVRAIEIVECALQQYGPPVHVFHEIVHNGHVVAGLKARGAVFVDRIDAIPRGAIVIFSAHGVGHAVVEQARQRGLSIVDATCPLVAKVHAHAQRYAHAGRPVIVIGHRGHDEVEGTLGAIDGEAHVVSDLRDVANLPLADDAEAAYVTQTTLSVDDTRLVIDALEARFPRIEGPSTGDICYATQNRQDAVRALARQVGLLLVVGSRGSSNTRRLQEVGEQCGVPARLIESSSEIERCWFDGVDRVGVTSGASTPEVLVRQVCERLVALGASRVRTVPGRQEDVEFKLPPLPTASNAVHALA